jgi:hypothetical protein
MRYSTVSPRLPKMPRQDPHLGLRALHAVEVRRLVDLVHEAHRHQQMPGADVGLGAPQEVERRELDGHRARARAVVHVARSPVLELDLRVEDDAVGELVSEVEHGAERIGAVEVAVLLVADEVDVVRLAVAADREAAVDAVDLGGRRTEAVGALQLRLLGHRDLRAEVRDLLGEHVHAPHQLRDRVVALADLVLGRARRGRHREEGERHEREPGRSSHRASKAPGRRERWGSGLGASGLGVNAIQWVRLQRRQNSSTPPSTSRASRLPHTQRQSSLSAATVEGMGGVMKMKMEFDFDRRYRLHPLARKGRAPGR